MALPTSLKFSDPVATGGHFLAQAGTPRLRPKRAAMHHSSSPSPSSSPRIPDYPPHPATPPPGSHQYPPLLGGPFDDDLYHSPRRHTRWRMTLALPSRIHRASISRFGRKGGPAVLCFCGLAFLLATYAVHRRYMYTSDEWLPPGTVFAAEEVRKVWEWEILAGHYPSTRPVPAEVGLTVALKNPSLPAVMRPPVPEAPIRYTIGTGGERLYPEVRAARPAFGHPPRPIPGSTADFDLILDNCDGDKGIYIRDCLEFMRLGAGLDDAARLRRDGLKAARYLFVASSEHASTDVARSNLARSMVASNGEFTDKPYMSMMAFLFTQNLGLHLEHPSSDPSVCRPQLWLPLPAPTFNHAIQFKLWNTTEQLDHTPELKNEWREMGGDLMQSEGRKRPKSDKKVGSDVALDGNSKEDHTSYNKLPVILSDLVRFVLCHRYGGAYLDIVSGYLREAHMDELLYRLPDALFDPAWKSADYVKSWWGFKTSYFERDRPPFPFFPDFDNFFNTPPETSAVPSVAGFDSFFRGAYAYHYHNEWWKPFDRARYWPDLGPRFTPDAEPATRQAYQGEPYPGWQATHDKHDLDWATVLKRTFEAYIRGDRPNMYGEWIHV
ncbi:uncharacterized protein BXZ73DRAFT_96633 [Epithele typhae]|uniref:uncharacterized protein n=1 Tax=Epithele typhae TaxID=378194 RepID=UPI002008CE23|nr:uncharacterized protein BXZ73DRAFT_96633 [Epithele typhae]KAH9944136.1 hypothetical protein BXZ73DRAFT_96633 [Epithele typhae]